MAEITTRSSTHPQVLRGRVDDNGKPIKPKPEPVVKLPKTHD